MLLKIKKTALYGYNSETLKFNICYLTDEIASKINNKLNPDYCYSSINENQNLFLLLDKPFRINNKSILNEYKRLLNKDKNIIWMHEEFLEEV